MIVAHPEGIMLCSSCLSYRALHFPQRRYRAVAPIEADSAFPILQSQWLCSL